MRTLARILTFASLLASLCATAAARDWPYPRHDAQNTAATDIVCRFDGTPEVLWETTLNNDATGSYLSVKDIDGDFFPEIFLGDWGEVIGEDYFGWVYSIDGRDGSLNWSRTIDSWIKWASPIVQDFDNDGRDEIAVGAGSLYLLDATSGLQQWKRLVNLGMGGMTAYDLDGDGHIEIFASDFQVPRWSHLLNSQGTVLWSYPQEGSIYNLPAIGEVDQDGQLEIVFLAHAPEIRERLHVLNPAGALEWSYLAQPSAEQLSRMRPEVGHLPDFGYTSAGIVDLDNDGDLEISAGTDMNHYAFEGQPPPSAQDPLVGPVNNHLIWKSPTTIFGNGTTIQHNLDGTTDYSDHHYQIFDAARADLNGDGFCDVVFGTNTDYDYILFALGGANFIVIREGNHLVALSGENGDMLWEFQGIDRSPYPGFMHDPIIADLDGDGDMDVLAPSNDGNLYAVDGSSGTELWRYTSGGFIGRGLAVADIDRDGTGEILLVVGDRLLALDRGRPREHQTLRHDIY